MILGEVEYTVWRDEQGRVTTEDGPGAMPTEIPEQVSGGALSGGLGYRDAQANGGAALSGGWSRGCPVRDADSEAFSHAPPALPPHCPRMLRSGGTATSCGRTPPFGILTQPLTPPCSPSALPQDVEKRGDGYVLRADPSVWDTDSATYSPLLSLRTAPGC